MKICADVEMCVLKTNMVDLVGHALCKDNSTGRTRQANMTLNIILCREYAEFSFHATFFCAIVFCDKLD